MHALGKPVQPPIGMSEIETKLTRLWFAGVTPAKLNLGLAYCGRIYTLSNSSCTDISYA